MNLDEAVEYFRNLREVEKFSADGFETGLMFYWLYELKARRGYDDCKSFYEVIKNEIHGE